MVNFEKFDDAVQTICGECTATPKECQTCKVREMYRNLLYKSQTNKTLADMVKQQLGPIYDDVCFELTNYENSSDEETTDEEWKDTFYDLLYRIINGIDCLQ